MAAKVQNDGFALSATQRTLPIALLRARETLMERFRPMLLAHGLTEQQWRVMRVLQESGEMDATELARTACILAPSLSRILKNLESKDFLKVRKDPQDGRRTLIMLTPKCVALIQSITPESAAIYAEIEASIGRDRIDSLLDDIQAMLTALERKG